MSRQNEYIDTQSSFSVNDIDQNPTWYRVQDHQYINTRWVQDHQYIDTQSS